MSIRKSLPRNWLRLNQSDQLRQFNSPWIIVKFGKKEHLEKLRAGYFYLNPWDYFRTCESNVQRDEYEGTDQLFNCEKSEIRIDEYPFSSEGGTINASLSFANHDVKVFCASAIYRGDEVRGDWRIFDEKIKDFGDALLIIRNPELLFERLIKAFEILKRDGRVKAFVGGAISYYDENSYDGEIGPFRKPLRFQWQKEWRIAVEAINCSGAVEFQVEPLGDIADLLDIEGFKNKIELKPDKSGCVLIFS